MKPKVLLIGPMIEPVMTVLNERYDVINWWELRDQSGFLRTSASGIRAVVTNGHLGVDPEVMKSLPDLEIVSSYGVGYDAINIPAADALGIPVTNTPDVLTDDVADLALGMMICLFRNIHHGDRYIRDGGWQKGPLPLARTLKGCRFGIVGLGRIGTAIANRAEGFGWQIAWTDIAPNPSFSWPFFPTVLDLAAASDILCLACNANDDNHHLVGAEVLDALGPHGVLVNSARGSLVDERALISALQQGRIWGAALDVFEDEPNVPIELLEHPRVLVQPHVGSATDATRNAMGDLVLENLRLHFAGEALLTPVKE